MVGRIETHGFSMEYIAFGEGARTLVILPGIGLLPLSPMAAEIEARYTALNDDFRVVLFDRREDPPEGYTVAEMAEDTAAAMQALGLSDALVLGVSQGGMMAQCLAVDHPELVGGLVLASALYRQNAVSRAAFGEWLRFIAAGDGRALCRSFCTRVYSPAMLRTIDLDGLDATPAQLHRAGILVKAALDFDFTDGVGQITCPCLVLGAEDDAVTAVQGSRELIEALGCEGFLYPGYCHAVYDEAADFCSRIADFAARHGFSAKN